MKSSKNEAVYLVLTILCVILIGSVYFIFGKSRQVATPSNTTAQPTLTQINTKQVETAKTALKTAEDNLSEDSLAMAQEALQQVQNEKNLLDLQAQLDQLSTELTNQQIATTAVETAEASLTDEDLQTAKEIVQQLKDGNKKTELENRLNALTPAA